MYPDTKGVPAKNICREKFLRTLLIELNGGDLFSDFNSASVKNLYINGPEQLTLILFVLQSGSALKGLVSKCLLSSSTMASFNDSIFYKSSTKKIINIKI